MQQSVAEESSALRPFAPEDVIESMGHLDDATISKITHENAMAAYSFDLFARIPKTRHGLAPCACRQLTSMSSRTWATRPANVTSTHGRG